jgi:hypothetical protein
VEPPVTHGTDAPHDHPESAGKHLAVAVEMLDQAKRSRAQKELAHRLLLRRSKEENGLARSSSPAMLPANK